MPWIAFIIQPSDGVVQKYYRKLWGAFEHFKELEILDQLLDIVLTSPLNIRMKPMIVFVHLVG